MDNKVLSISGTNRRGRPRKLHVKLKNGFYIEVCEIGSNKGMKIWRESKKDMDTAASQYAGFKNVIILGEYKDGAALL